MHRPPHLFWCNRGHHRRAESRFLRVVDDAGRTWPGRPRGSSWGSPCVVMPCRNPIFLAKQTATPRSSHAGAARGRIGLGSKGDVRVRTSSRCSGSPSRSARPLTDEYTEAMLAIWTQDKATFHGPTIQFNGPPRSSQSHSRSRTRPVWGRPGWTDKAAERNRAAWATAGSPWLAPRQPRMAKGAEVLRRTAIEVGRNPDDITDPPSRSWRRSTRIGTRRSSGRPADGARASSNTYERDVDKREVRARSPHLRLGRRCAAPGRRVRRGPGSATSS